MGAGRNVEEHHLIGPLLVVPNRQLDGVADIPEFTGLRLAKLDTPGYLARMHIEAGDYAFGDHAED
jgi:hypothetical protein